MTIKHYKEDKLRLKDYKTGRIVVTWNRFARSLKEAFEFYTEAKQAEFYSWLETLPSKLRKVPFKQMIIAFLPFISFLLIYSNYRIIRESTGLSKIIKPNSSFLPWLELLVFHCYPHQILKTFSNPVFDFVAAVPYLIHFPLPFFFAVYKLFCTRTIQGTFPFMWCAGWVNLVAVIIQLLFPTTPPWFVDSAVWDTNGELMKAGANEAGFHRIDGILGMPFFHSIYSASPVKFGAFPSLHVAWPAIILVCGPWINEKFAMLHVAWITWAALYSNHHYGVDALAGLMLVFLVNFMMRKVWSPFKTIEKSTRVSLSRSRSEPSFHV
ncbi:predicted protein [Nematostella vectensis]|uniref:Inositolphosphotransferase Aur1/Ipt1 domain-containing protein n=1 Tax=Nematostella vectensis TaxID=45351 RepID=A7SBC7_NEMVE|nr:inositol phosphorylceramide synthase [Nematostella vectensis]EDO39005.1 predicted protein [Nematostella vectensis]|eukprot:XP_001631068.1 predicted protein [Nematostella vectensis]